MTEKKRGDSRYKGLGDNDDRGIQLEGEERTLKPSWRGDAEEYLWEMHGCGLLAMEKCERRHKRELEKSAFQKQSIIKIFST